MDEYGTMMLLGIIGLFVFLIVLFILNILSKQWQTLAKTKQALSKLLFFNIPIRVYIQGYVLFSISSFKNLKLVTNGQFTGKATIIITYFMFLMTFFFPFWVVYFLWNFSKKEGRSKWKKRTTALRTGVKEGEEVHWMITMYYGLFLIRRLVFCLLIEFLGQEWGCLPQLALINFTFVAFALYLATIKPFQDSI